jgi:cytidine deaminase
MSRVDRHVDWELLREAAVAAMQRAYAPYSKYPVGAAALIDDGRVVAGCNVENASYGMTLCAECGVVSQLHASGGGRIVALACVDASGEPLMPCGRCRQLLWEHGGPNCLIDARTAPRTMAELLPLAFDSTDLALAEGTALAVPARLRGYEGTGTVFVHPDVAGAEQVWTGYWERSAGVPGEHTGILEEAPNWADPAEAVAWGRARTHRVVVVGADGELSWAGEGDPPGAIPRRWSA